MDRFMPNGGNMPHVLSMGIYLVSLGWHIHSSLSMKKYRLFQFLLESGVPHTSLNNGLLGIKLYIPFD